MSTQLSEPGTYRTRSGILIHSRTLADGSVIVIREDGATHGRTASEDLVKLSDDPNWPDVTPSYSDPQLFAD